jgi:hypothetical protein
LQSLCLIGIFTIHVSQPKKHYGANVVPSPDLPMVVSDGKMQTEPVVKSCKPDLCLVTKFKLPSGWLSGLVWIKQMPLGRMPISSRVCFWSSIHLLFVVGALIPTLEEKCNALGEVLSYLKITLYLTLD